MAGLPKNGKSFSSLTIYSRKEGEKFLLYAEDFIWPLLLEILDPSTCKVHLITYSNGAEAHLSQKIQEKFKDDAKKIWRVQEQISTGKKLKFVCVDHLEHPKKMKFEPYIMLIGNKIVDIKQLV